VKNDILWVNVCVKKGKTGNGFIYVARRGKSRVHNATCTQIARAFRVLAGRTPEMFDWYDWLEWEYKLV